MSSHLLLPLRKQGPGSRQDGLLLATALKDNPHSWVVHHSAVKSEWQIFSSLSVGRKEWDEKRSKWGGREEKREESPSGISQAGQHNDCVCARNNEIAGALSAVSECQALTSSIQVSHFFCPQFLYKLLILQHQLNEFISLKSFYTSSVRQKPRVHPYFINSPQHHWTTSTKELLQVCV